MPADTNDSSVRWANRALAGTGVALVFAGVPVIGLIILGIAGLLWILRHRWHPGDSEQLQEPRKLEKPDSIHDHLYNPTEAWRLQNTWHGTLWQVHEDTHDTD